MFSTQRTMKEDSQEYGRWSRSFPVERSDARPVTALFAVSQLAQLCILDIVPSS